MPPFNDFDRGLNGNLLKNMWEIGHGARIVIVDASYHVPFGGKVVNSSSSSTPNLLREAVRLVPMDNNEIIAMKSDKPGPCHALAANIAVAEFAEVDLVAITAKGEPNAEEEYARSGFYALANDPELRDSTLFVRTTDEKAFACAMFVVGHSQE